MATTPRYRRLGILSLVAQFFGFLAVVVIIPTFALSRLSPWFWLLIPCGLIAVLVMRATLPARMTVQPNGILLNPAEAPALFELCESAACAAGFTKPFAVYVDFSPVPSSMRRLTAAGFASRYAIILGLPSLQLLSGSELRTVLLYLFTSLRSTSLSDTWLADIRQVVTRFSIQRGLPGRIVKRYVARADALLGMRTAGAPMTERFAAALPVFKRFWMNDVNPLLQRGFIPPVIEGYLRVLEKTGTASNYPLADSALSLLLRPWQVEQHIASALGKTRATGLQQVSWELVPWRVILPSWEEEIQPFIPVLSALQVRDVAQFAEHRLLELGRRLFARPGAVPGPEQLKWKAARTLAVALALTLRRTGWQLAYDGAGDPWEFRYGLRSLNPFDSVDLLASRRMLEDEWISLCDEIGIAQLPLAVS